MYITTPPHNGSRMTRKKNCTYLSRFATAPVSLSKGALRIRVVITDNKSNYSSYDFQAEVMGVGLILITVGLITVGYITVEFIKTD
jgi:hypothetical protein